MPGALDITQKSAAYEKRVEQWDKVRDCIEGEDQIKEKKQTYLPRPSAQDDKDYRAYRDRSVFYGVSERTLLSLVGLVFRIEPEVDLVPSIEGIEQAATPEGDDLDTLLREAIREVMSLGRFGLLVDMPKDQGIRPVPYLAAFTAENIWRWEERFDPVAAERVLTRLVLHSDPLVQDDVETDILHELFLDEETGFYTIQIWEKEEAESADTTSNTQNESDEDENGGYRTKDEPVVPVINGAPLKRIPFVFINPTDLKPEARKPPMLDLSNMNIAHYRNSADLEHSLHLTAEPTPWTAADWEAGEEPTSIGSATIWHLPLNGKAGMLEFTGAGISAIEKTMSDKEQRMAALGARLIRDQERANVTAETTRLQSKAEESVLVSTTRNVEAGFRRAIGIATEWVGGDPEQNSLELNKDFVETRLGPQELTALVGGWQVGAYSHDTLWANLQAGEIADPKRSAEDERDLIEEQTPDAPEAVTGPADAAGAPQLQAGGSIKAAGATGPGGSDGHSHAFELTIADDGAITGRALAQAPDGAELDHEHGIERLDRTEEADSANTGRHAHGLPLSGQNATPPGPEGAGSA